MVRMIASVLMLTVGVTFIVIASIGVARLPDVFQRMHSATKAGGIGTSLVLLGVLTGGFARPVTAVLAIVFMLLTLSVSSQLLARAAYMSGATLEGIDGKDELAGILDREQGPLEERTHEG